MNHSQAKLLLSLTAATFAAAAWLYSFHLAPGKGFLRSLFFFGALWLTLGRYDNAFRTVSQEFPFNQTLVGVTFVVWLFIVLAGVLISQSLGYEIPSGRGINRPLSALVLILPMLGAIGWRFKQIYNHLGSSGA